MGISITKCWYAGRLCTGVCSNSCGEWSIILDKKLQNQSLHFFLLLRAARGYGYWVVVMKEVVGKGF